MTLLTKTLMYKLSKRTIIEQQIYLFVWLKPNYVITNMEENVRL